MIDLALALVLTQLAHSTTKLAPYHTANPREFSLYIPEVKTMSSRVLVEGEIVFEETGMPFSDATIYVRLENTSRADAAAVVIAEQTIRGVSRQAGASAAVPIRLSGQISDDKDRYMVQVHVDVDGSGSVSAGDYINMESYPVLTHGHTSHPQVHVRQVR